MIGREELIYNEAVALWTRLYGAPPPSEADGSAILALIVGGLSEADYNRIATPHLRPSAITFPKGR